MSVILLASLHPSLSGKSLFCAQDRARLMSSAMTPLSASDTT
jgi:hypothetical protein